MPTNKSPQVQQAVIAKRLQGESKHKIARDLEMGRDTVDRIQNESQVEAAVAQGRTQLAELVPKAIQLIQRAIDQGLAANEVPKSALEAAIHVVKGSGTYYGERSRTRGDVHVHDDYAKADREQLESELAERLGTFRPSRPN
jgi:hypothetical protein